MVQHKTLLYCLDINNFITFVSIGSGKVLSYVNNMIITAYDRGNLILFYIIFSLFKLLDHTIAN